MQTKNKDTRIRGGKFLQRFCFDNTREFKAKRVAGQISHIPGSPGPSLSLEATAPLSAGELESFIDLDIP